MSQLYLVISYCATLQSLSIVSSLHSTETMNTSVNVTLKCTWTEDSGDAKAATDRLAELVKVERLGATAPLPPPTTSASNPAKIQAHFSRKLPSSPPCEISAAFGEPAHLRSIDVVTSARVCEVYIDGSYWETFRGNALNVLDDVQLFQICISGKAPSIRKELSLRLLSLRSNKDVLFFSSMRLLVSAAPKEGVKKGAGGSRGVDGTTKGNVVGMEGMVMHTAMAMEARVVGRIEQVVKDFEARMQEKLKAMELRILAKLKEGGKEDGNDGRMADS